METNSNETILRGLFYNKVTTANEKIRIIKDEFNLSLRSLRGEDLSNAGISYIINGINGVTEHSGSILVKNINSLLGTNVKLDWLLEDATEQTDRLLENNIESYKKGQISIGDFEKIVNNNTSYSKTNLLLEAYELLVEYYYKKTDYSKALSYVDKGVEISFKICDFEREITFKKHRGNIDLKQGYVSEALRIYKFIKDRTTNKEIQAEMHYNIIICLRKLKEFKDMLTEMALYEKTYKISEEDKRSLKMMKANSYSILKEYENALEIYKGLLNESMKLNNSKDICRLSYNIADIHFEIGDLGLAEKYMKLSLNYEDDFNIVKHLLFAATVFNDLMYIQKAKEKLVEGDLNSLQTIYNKEIELCIKCNNIKMLKITLDNCIEQNIRIERLANLNRFIYHNFEKEDYEKYLELLEDKECS